MQHDAYLSFVEKAALENAKFHLGVTEALSKEAHTLFNLLFVVAGASLGLLVEVVRSEEGWEFATFVTGAFFLTAYLAALAVGVALIFMRHKEVHPPASEPKVLMIEGFSLSQLRAAELTKQQERIEKNRDRNEAAASGLNAMRAATLAAPLVWLAGIEVVYLIRLWPFVF